MHGTIRQSIVGNIYALWKQAREADPFRRMPRQIIDLLIPSVVNSICERNGFASISDLYSSNLSYELMLLRPIGKHKLVFPACGEFG